MRVIQTIRRWRDTAMPLSDQLSVAGELAAGWADVLRLRTDDAWAHIESAHDRSRNAGLLHTQAHLLRVVGWGLQGRPGALVRELPLVVMAAPAAHVRRAAGLAPDQEGGVGLLATWRMRPRG